MVKDTKIDMQNFNIDLLVKSEILDEFEKLYDAANPNQEIQAVNNGVICSKDEEFGVAPIADLSIRNILNHVEVAAPNGPNHLFKFDNTTIRYLCTDNGQANILKLTGGAEDDINIMLQYYKQQLDMYQHDYFKYYFTLIHYLYLIQ
jgi:hypothetical protein